MTWLSVTFTLHAPAMVASFHFQEEQSSFLSELSSYFRSSSCALLLLILPVSALLHSFPLLYNNLQFAVAYGRLPRERQRAFQAEVKANASMCKGSDLKLCVFEKLKRKVLKDSLCVSLQDCRLHPWGQGRICLIHQFT